MTADDELTFTIRPGDDRWQPNNLLPDQPERLQASLRSISEHLRESTPKLIENGPQFIASVKACLEQTLRICARTGTRALLIRRGGLEYQVGVDVPARTISFILDSYHDRLTGVNTEAVCRTTEDNQILIDSVSAVHLDLNALQRLRRVLNGTHNGAIAWALSFW